MAREARDARVAELESENEALRQHLQRVEAAAAAQQAAAVEAAGGGAAAAAAAPAGGGMRLAQLEGEASLLRRKVAELQKGMDRLQQVGWPGQPACCGATRCWRHAVVCSR